VHAARLDHLDVGQAGGGERGGELVAGQRAGDGSR